MKNLLFNLSALCLIFGSCSSNAPQKESHVIIWDRSDSLLVNPPTSTQEITRFLKLEETPNQVTCRLTVITDKRHTPKHDVLLEANTSGFDYNPFVRNKEIQGFADKVSLQLKTLSQQRIGYDQSLVFATLFKQLKGEGEARTIHLFSDVRNASKGFNSYRPFSRESLATHLQEAYPLPCPVSGTKVIIYFEPKNQQEDEVFEKISQVLRAYLETSGIEVEIKSSLP